MGLAGARGPKSGSNPDVRALYEKGVEFNRYPQFKQDELGIWAAPRGGVSVAWFKDPDGNVLSVTNA